VLGSLILASVLPSSENDIGVPRRGDGRNGLSDTELSSECEASEMVVGTRRGGFLGFSSSCCMKKRASEKILCASCAWGCAGTTGTVATETGTRGGVGN
jgi:hypothetical protein